jgi:hypothetical protein
MHSTRPPSNAGSVALLAEVADVRAAGSMAVRRAPGSARVAGNRARREHTTRVVSLRGRLRPMPNLGRRKRREQ